MDLRDTSVVSLPRRPALVAPASFAGGAPGVSGFARKSARLQRRLGLLLWAGLTALVLALSS